MAESLDDAEFWLPPQFLADEDVVVKPDPLVNKGSAGGFGFGFPFEGFGGPLGSGGASPDLNSPVESVVGSSETESDEEDFLAGLSLQMARSTLDNRAYGKNDNQKTWTHSGSPQSTLCAALGGGCGFGFGFGEQGSSRGSPNAAGSRVSSPPPPPQPLDPAPGTWDLLNAAAGEVAKFRTAAEEEEERFIHNQKLRSDYQRQYQFEQLRQLQILKQQQQLRYHQYQSNRGRYQSYNPHTVRTLGLPSSAWPTLQQAQNPQTGSGMRAVFLGNPAAGKRECAGTGVFLPRQVGTQPEPRRKPGCSTVLLPARVVQALNLNLDNVGNPRPQAQPRFNGRVASESDMTMIRLRNHNTNTNNGVSYQKRNVRPPQQQVNNHEIRLPQDWTY